MTDGTTTVDPEPATGPATRDATLDAGKADDRTYLHQLGYRQELRRALGLFSSFAVQWTSIAVAGGLALSLGAGLTQVGPAVFFAWLIAAGFQMVVARVGGRGRVRLSTRRWLLPDHQPHSRTPVLAGLAGRLVADRRPHRRVRHRGLRNHSVHLQLVRSHRVKPWRAPALGHGADGGLDGPQPGRRQGGGGVQQLRRRGGGVRRHRHHHRRRAHRRDLRWPLVPFAQLPDLEPRRGPEGAVVVLALPVRDAGARVRDLGLRYQRHGGRGDRARGAQRAEGTLEGQLHELRRSGRSSSCSPCSRSPT